MRKMIKENIKKVITEFEQKIKEKMKSKIKRIEKKHTCVDAHPQGITNLLYLNKVGDIQLTKAECRQLKLFKVIFRLLNKTAPPKYHWQKRAAMKKEV